MRSLAILAFVVLGCVDMAQQSSTKIAGLWTNPNDARAPEGALSVADNVVLSRPGVAEPRRGFTAQNSALGEAINALAYFDGHLIAHTGASTLRRSSDDGATWTSYSGAYSPPDSSTVVKFWEHAGSLFFLTAAGVYELDDATGTPRLTGVTRAQDGTATLDRVTSSGWFDGGSAGGQVAYRVAWLYRNGNEKTQYGAASGRFLVTNPAAVDVAIGQASIPNGSATVTVNTATAHGLTTGDYATLSFGGAETTLTAGTYAVTVTDTDTFTFTNPSTNSSGSAITNATAWTVRSVGNVSLSVPIPAEVTTDYALQVFRSAVSVSEDTEPSDALGLVYEAIPTNVDITAGTISIEDVTPDSLRGVDWQDVVTGGPVHERPPLAKDAAVFRGCTFYGSVDLGLSTDLRMISVPELVPGMTSTFALLYDTVTGQGFNASSTVESGTTWRVYTSGTTAQNIADTSRSLVRAINSATGTTGIAAIYLSSDADPPGLIRLRAVNPTTTYRYVATTQMGRRVFAPNLRTTLVSAAGQVSRAGSTVTVNMQTPHGLVVGETFSLRGGSADFPGGTKTVASVIDADSLTYTEAGAATSSGSSFLWDVPSLTASLELTSGAYSNSLMWSPPGEPWHVPLLNQAFVGHEGTAIKAVVPTRDKLVIFTDAGAYQLYGDYPNFALAELDTTLRLAAYNTAVPMAGRVFGLTTTGVVEVQDSARVVSIPIEDSLRDLLANHSSNLALRSFAVPYESERMLLLWLPDDSSDAYAAQAFVYHLDSGQWTRWTAAATSGFIHPAQDRLYLGTATTGVAWKERKARSTADHRDSGAPNGTTYNYSALNVGALTLTVSSSAGLLVGDVITDGFSGSGATITAINGTTVTVDQLDDFAAPGTFTVSIPGSVAITSTVEWAPVMPAGPGAQALADSGSLDFQEANFATGSMYFATNLSPTLSDAVSVAPPGGATTGAVELVFPLPQAQQRATRYRVRFTHATASERYQLQGMTLNFRATSRRPGR